MRPSLPLGQQQLPSLPQTQGDIAACLALAIALGFWLRKPWDLPDPYQHVYYEKPQLKNGGGNGRAAETRNIAKKLKESVRDNCVLTNPGMLRYKTLTKIYHIEQRLGRFLGLAVRYCRGVRKSPGPGVL